MPEESKTQQVNTSRKSISFSGTLAAPSIAICTAALYITGYGYRRGLLESFGSSAEAISLSFQDTLAYSRTPIFLILISTGLFILLGSFISVIFKKYVSIFLNFLFYRKARFLIIHYIAIIISYIFIIIGLGLYFGIFVGAKKAEKIKYAVEAACWKDCFVYHTKATTVLGLIVAEDSRRLIVYAVGEGLVFIPSSDLKSIEPFYPTDGGRASTEQLFPTPPRRQPKLGD